MNGQVKKFYDDAPEREWARLEKHPIEFRLTAYMLEKHIQPGDRVLDIGGGPGRYSIHFAKMGCDVTLVDLSDGNIELAKVKAQEAGVKIEAHACDCLELDRLNLGQFDHVLLMGPLYHLPKEEDRVTAVRKALDRLKPGGTFYASFILLGSGLIRDLKVGGCIVEDMANPATNSLVDDIIHSRPYTGGAFSTVCFYPPDRIEGFMESFGLEKLHLFGQEGILAPNEFDILRRDEAEIECWIDVAKRLLEAPEMLAFSEHAMYIGRKNVMEVSK